MCTDAAAIFMPYYDDDAAKVDIETMPNHFPSVIFQLFIITLIFLADAIL